MGKVKSVFTFAGALVGTMMAAGKNIKDTFSRRVEKPGLAVEEKSRPYLKEPAAGPPAAGPVVELLGRSAEAESQPSSEEPVVESDAEPGIQSELLRRLNEAWQPPALIAETETEEIAPAEGEAEHPEVVDMNHDEIAAEEKKKAEAEAADAGADMETEVQESPALIAEAEGEPSSEEPVVQTDAEAEMETETQESPPRIAEAEIPPLADVTAEESSEDVFASAVEEVVFNRALSDMAGKDIARCVAGVKAIGGIRHKRSVGAILAHVAHETCAEVRKECINALTALKMKEGLAAVEQALADPAASVRLAAVWGVYRLAGVEGVAALTRMFRDENESVRRRAAACVGWLGQESKDEG